VLIGAVVRYFLTHAEPQKVTNSSPPGLGRTACWRDHADVHRARLLMDSLAMIILTIPIIFPVITQLGFDRSGSASSS